MQWAYCLFMEIFRILADYRENCLFMEICSGHIACSWKYGLGNIAVSWKYGVANIAVPWKYAVGIVRVHGHLELKILPFHGNMRLKILPFHGNMYECDLAQDMCLKVIV